MSKGAVKNPDHKRDIRERPMPPEIAAVVEPGTRAYRMGACGIFVSKQRVGWHLSISHPKRLPTWEEVRDARYALIPDEAVMAMLLPPRGDYLNLHEYTLQMYEVPPGYWTDKDRL